MEGCLLDHQNVQIEHFQNMLFLPAWNLEPGTWNYVGTSYNFSSGVVKIWINGSEVAHEISGGEEQSTQYDVRVGAKASTTDRRYLKGRICCLQIYNKSLSQKEIIAVQNRTLNTCKYDVS